MYALLKPLYLRVLSLNQWQVVATALSFFALGFSTAAWAPLIPMVQQHLHLTHSQFGILLLGAGVGSMLSMPLAGRLAHRFGCRPVLAILLIAFSLILPALALSPSFWALAVTLVLFGASAGALGVTVNLQAIQVESQQQKSLMSMFHGICSLGGLGGVLLMTLLLSFGLPALISALVISALIAVLFVVAIPFCLSARAEQNIEAAESTSTKSSRISLSILCIGLICFISFLSEGAAMDWSGIYLTSHFHVQAHQAGLAYSCFAALMVAGRLSGHLIVRVFGEKNTILYSAILASVGMLTVVFAPVWYIVLAGYAIVGLGSSNIVPLMFSRAGRQTQMQKHIALSYVSVFAYTGSLVGPALVGFGSEAIGLSHVFFVMAIGIFCISVLNQLASGQRVVADQQTPA